jgi:hypothetical protein
VWKGSKVVTKNDVGLGLRTSAVMASLSAEMKPSSNSVSGRDSPGFANLELTLL